jgi:uncharacterized membrane-anchored protein
MPVKAAFFLLLVGLQAAIVLAFAGGKELQLRGSQDVILQTAPVDPRDLFRGDYVALRYTMSRLPDCFQDVGATGYVPLFRQGDVWGPPSGRLVFFAKMQDARKNLASGQEGVVLKGRVTGSGSQSCEVAYGIESYFLPEGTGRAIERSRAQLRVRVAVDGFGGAIIRELVPAA